MNRTSNGSQQQAPVTRSASIDGQTPAPLHLHPEIRSLVQLINAHAHKIYFSGPLMRRFERQPDGQKPPKDEGWTEVWAQLGGTNLSIWDMKEIQEASKQGREVPPSYINVTDAFIQVLGSVTVPPTPTAPSKRHTNVITLNTAGSNLLLFSCPTTAALISWAAALRLAAWEKSRLEEIYTAHLIRITLDSRDIPTTLVRGGMEGWAMIRIAGQTDWKRVWLVVQEGSGVEGDGAGPAGAGVQATKKRNRMSNVFSRETNASNPLPAKSMISMFTSSKPKDLKKPLLTVYGITQAFGVYPERPELINRSTLLKVEGTFGNDEMAAAFKMREGWVLIMPELANNVGQAAEMLRWVVGLHDAFELYGRPEAWTWDPRDPISLMFGYPVGPQKDNLFLEREIVEGMDPRDHRTSVVHSMMKNLLQAHLNPAVQVVQPHSAPRDRSPPRSPSAPENTPPTDVQVWGTQIPPTTPEPARSSFLPLSNRDKLVVAIDFGTTFSGVAYGSTIHTNGQVRLVLKWPGSTESYRKIPTALLYNETGLLAWGLEAKHARVEPDEILCEWFKSYLDPVNLRSPGTFDPDLPKLPPGKDAIDVIADYLQGLYAWARREIENDLRELHFETEVWIMVPSKWDTKGIAMLREACFKAGIVSRYDVDVPGRDQLRVVTEAQAASLHCAADVGLASMKNGQQFLVCDAGGGTVDIAVHKVVGDRSANDIAEVSVQTGGKCGSLFLDLRFEKVVTILMEDHPVHRDFLSRRYFMYAFSSVEKISFTGDEHEDNEFFYFNCFNVEDSNAPEVGLINGSLSIPGILLRREVFDPVINEVLELIDAQVQKCNEPLQHIFLVGGFAGNPYLLRRVKERFTKCVSGAIVRPPDADTAALRGAVMYGMQVDAGLPVISNVVAPRSYIMKVKLPAEPKDWLERPAYISTNRAGIPICKKRLQYLIKKGDVVEKGAKIRTTFSKFSKNAQDSIFTAVLYTSEHPEMLRYTDSGDLVEICKWTVDLASLPSFMQNANIAGASKPFYTEFEVGLELDSAEVRGVLLYNGVESARVVFDFLI